MGKKDERKFENLNRLIELLLDHPEGLIKAEIARRLNVDRSTAADYLDSLEAMNAPVYEVSPDRFTINRDRYQVKISVDMHEALALHLATRLLTTRTDKHNPHAASALRKLGRALEKLAPLISEHMKRSADVLDSNDRRRDPIFMQALETLTRAWSRRRKVRLTHEMDDGKIHEYTFSPYFIEPYAVGRTMHTIGYREPPGEIRTFKIERIRTIQLLENALYEIPITFDPRAQLKNAWGIWFSERKPEIVKLHFTRNVAKRVQETVWHYTEEITEQADGSVIWTVQIADWQEMLPWVRGWGADVEVLGPEELREILAQTVCDLNKRYQILPPQTRLLFQIPYAKTNPDNKQQIHLLIYHLIDAGLVALILWERILTQGIRDRLASLLKLNDQDCGRFIAFLVSLHDLGKAGPGYQKKYAPDWLKRDLNEAGLVLEGSGRAYEKTTPHGTVSTWALLCLLQDIIGLDEPFARKIAVAVGGHHGVWPPLGSIDLIDDHKHQKWDILRRDLIWELMAVFCPPNAVAPPQNPSELNTFLTILSGLTSVADWIGSRNKEHFGFVEQPLSIRLYAKQAKENALKALSDLGWIGWQPIGEVKTFAETFAYLNFDEPRPVQRQVIETARELQPPTLIILEAPTGIGKTEIALYLADLWLQQHKGRGLYVAMPTTATSNQMYERVGKFLDLRYPEMNVNYHLVHGQAAWMDKLKKQVELQGVGDDAQAHVIGESWFTPRKRTLLAPFGVGTVDQTLMSILQTKHFFVRLFGLSHKVIIFDEVHAYDTYMNTLFHRLLEWLHAIGTSVIILSATLPAKTRRELVKAYSGQELPETNAIYPALTIANAQQLKTIPLEAPKSYPLQLDWSVGREPQEIVTHLKQELAESGCAAVICNTVRRAQDVFSALATARGDLDILEDDLILFHGRFPPVWREDIEKKVLKKFGKPDENGESPHRPHKAIVVATQVIEQSLDLDFDVMITDLAPVDLILQRAGRLHRHKRKERKHERKLVITQLELDENGIPVFEGDKFYGLNLLLRSYLALYTQTELSLPEDTKDLIEAVYNQEISLKLPSEIWKTRLTQTLSDLQDQEWQTRNKAERYVVLSPSKHRLLDQNMFELEEDDPELHETFRAQTRDIDLSLTLVCLQKNGEAVSIYLENDQLETFNLEDPLPFGLSKKLLRNALALQHKAVISHFLKQPIPTAWRKDAALMYCRYAIFDNGVNNDVPGYSLSLNRQLGLQIVKKETK